MHKNLINGEWVEPAGEKPAVTPSDPTDIVGVFGRADAAQARLAVEAARTAATGWAASTPQQRFNVLDMVGSEILARKEELGRRRSSTPNRFPAMRRSLSTTAPRKMKGTPDP